jgi:hypothetical protein
MKRRDDEARGDFCNGDTVSDVVNRFSECLEACMVYSREKASGLEKQCEAVLALAIVMFGQFVRR